MRRAFLWPIAIAVAVGLILPAAIGVAIRSGIAGYRDAGAIRLEEGARVNSVYLPSLKWTRFQEEVAKKPRRLIAWVGSSSSLIFSRPLIEKALACRIDDTFLNLAVHNTDALALARMLPKLYAQLGPGDLVVIGAYPRMLWTQAEAQNYDIYAPWLTPREVLSAAFGNNRGRLVPRLFDRQNFEVSTASFSALYRLLNEGPRTLPEEVWSVDGSTRFLSEQHILDQIRRGEHRPPAERHRMRFDQSRAWNVPALSDLGRIVANAKAQTVILDFVTWNEPPDQEYYDLIARHLPRARHLHAAVPRDFNLYFDEVHYLESGAAAALGSVGADARRIFCGGPG